MKTRIARRKWIWMLLAGILMLGLGVSQVSAAAGIAVVDQSNTAALIVYHGSVYWSPMGQEFTPSLPALDTVELLTSGLATATLQINIRENTINGPIVGTSLPVDVSIPSSTGNTVTHFAFPSLVSLVPSKLYVIELLTLSGDMWIGLTGNTYLGGALIEQGQRTTFDLWFKEGLANSIPLNKDYCKSGLWKNLATADGNSFKSQGDCIQYVNTKK